MSLILKKKLILLDSKTIEFDGRDGELVQKVKYTFLTPENDLYEAFEDAPGTYVGDEQSVDHWDETKAVEFPFKATLFKGETKYNLQPKSKQKKNLFIK